jgi:hypothetical protein
MPIIAFTASAMKEQEDKSKTLFDGYLPKPVEKKKLFNELMKFLPYKQFNDDLSGQEIKEELSCELKLIIPDLLDKLESVCLFKLEKIKDEFSIDLIEEFTAELKIIYTKYPISYIKSYISSIDEATQSFDISRIKILLNKYPEFIEKIKSLI